MKYLSDYCITDFLLLIHFNNFTLHTKVVFSYLYFSEQNIPLIILKKNNYLTVTLFVYNPYPIKSNIK